MVAPTYPHPRPRPPAQIWLLALLCGFGLIALWLAAYAAFQQIAGPGQAFFAASLIEAGLIIEALAVMRFGNAWAKIGLLASFIVSGTYNYIQANVAVAAEAGIKLSTWPLLTLSLGPLVALASVSLALGDTLSRHQVAVERWETDRAKWLEKREAEAAERQRQIDEQRAAWQRQQAEKQAAWERQQAEEQAAWDRQETERSRKRAERAEKERQKAADRPENQPEENGSRPAASGNLPAGLPVVPRDRDHFRQLVASGQIDPEQITGSQLAEACSISPRAGRDWLAEVKNGKEVTEQTNQK